MKLLVSRRVLGSRKQRLQQKEFYDNNYKENMIFSKYVQRGIVEIIIKIVQPSDTHRHSTVIDSE